MELAALEAELTREVPQLLETMYLGGPDVWMNGATAPCISELWALQGIGPQKRSTFLSEKLVKLKRGRLDEPKKQDVNVHKCSVCCILILKFIKGSFNMNMNVVSMMCICQRPAIRLGSACQVSETFRAMEPGLRGFDGFCASILLGTWGQTQKVLSL